jgi:hypothetical protein
MSYIETAARYEKMTEDGKVKKVTERFLVDALSCTEAEGRTIEELTPYVSGELEVTANKKVNIAEVMGDKECGRFWLCKVVFITIDEKTATEKRTISQILVGAPDFTNAVEELNEGMKGTLSDFEIVSLAETPIKEFYPAKL